MNDTLFVFMERLIAGFRNNGKYRTAETYRSALNSFKSFRNNLDVDFIAIDSALVESYETWMRNRGLIPNTTSFYMRILRAVYNQGVDLEYTDNRRPFRHVYTGVDRTVKRALTLSAMRRIRTLDLKSYPSLDFARDIFMLSFYLRGMSFIDMAFLRKSDLRYGQIVYRRRKTGQLLTIGWTNEMQQILNKYPMNPTHYLLPILHRHKSNERNYYRNISYNINHSLKRIGSMAGISIPLTLYVARHSWASIAHSNGIPVSIISEGMGHGSEATTRIYLADLDTALIDRANARIMKMR